MVGYGKSVLATLITYHTPHITLQGIRYCRPELLNHELCNGLVDDTLISEKDADSAYQDGAYHEAALLYQHLSTSPKGLFDQELYQYGVSLKMIGELGQAKEVFQEVVNNAEISEYDTLADLQIATILYAQEEIGEAKGKVIKIKERFPEVIKVSVKDPRFSGLEDILKQVA